MTSAVAASTYQVILTASNFGSFITGLTSKTTPVDADELGLVDSAASNVEKKITLTNLWLNYIKSKADAVYTTTSAVATQITTALSGYLTSSTAASTYEPIITTLPISKGGTNSGTALNNGRVIISSGGAIVEGDTATYPSTTELAYVKGATSAIQTQINSKEPTISAGTSSQYYRGDKTWQTLNTGAISGYQGYCLNGATVKSGASPADAATYFFGSTNQTVVASTVTGAGAQIYIPKAGTIKLIRLLFSQTVGSGESSTIYLRLNNTTDTTISSSVVNNTAYLTYSLSSSISVIAGDYVEFKWVTPTWATNPTNVGVSWQLYIE